MTEEVVIDRILTSPLSRYAALYGELIRNAAEYHTLGNRLIAHAEAAHSFRRMGVVREMGLLLSNMPVREFHYIGQYYLALAINNLGKGDIDTTRRIIEHIVDHLPSNYRPRAILTLASVSAKKRDFDSEFYYINEAIKAGGFNIIRVWAMTGMAIFKAREGFHKSALEDLENLYPMMRHAPAHYYFDYLNSLAVELGEVGRKQEARNVCKVVLASPYAFAFPVWHETAEELRGYSRSFVSVSSSTGRQDNVVSMPVSDHRDSSADFTSAANKARILSLQEWKMMPRNSDGPSKKGFTREEIKQMSTKQKLVTILRLITSDEITEDRLDKAIEVLGANEVDVQENN